MYAYHPDNSEIPYDKRDSHIVHGNIVDPQQFLEVYVAEEEEKKQRRETQPQLNDAVTPKTDVGKGVRNFDQKMVIHLTKISSLLSKKLFY